MSIRLQSFIVLCLPVLACGGANNTPGTGNQLPSGGSGGAPSTTTTSPITGADAGRKNNPPAPPQILDAAVLGKPDAGRDGGMRPPPPPPMLDASTGVPDAMVASDAAPPRGPGPHLPAVQGTCPDFRNGVITMDVGGTSRSVTLSMTSAAMTMHGPLVLYWYSTYHTPAEAGMALPVSQITAAGGIVAAPTHINGGTYPWLGTDAERQQDYDLADKIVACAIEKVGIDTKHIHSAGFSAGALFTTLLGFVRSDYLASVGMYSGGMPDPMPDAGTPAPPTYEDPTNKFAAMIITGGTSDNIFGVDFMKASHNYQTQLKMDGHSAMYCQHSAGHMIASGLVSSMWKFFQAHPYGTNPSPYVGAIPAGFTGCSF